MDLLIWGGPPPGPPEVDFCVIGGFFEVYLIYGVSDETEY